MASAKELNVAKQNKSDEFYTLYKDIELEMSHYGEDAFRGKTIYMPCDNPNKSMFWKFFRDNFQRLGIKQLIATHLETRDGFFFPPSYWRCDGSHITHFQLNNADFRKDECREIMEKSDVIITNPPFSLLKDFILQLIELDKQFIILGNINVVTCKDIFPLIRERKMWLGASIHSGDREFRVPDDYPLYASGYRVDEDGNKFIRVKGVRWFTNMNHDWVPPQIKSTNKTYSPDEYPEFVFYKAINVNRVVDVPIDYNGVIAVPITFLDKWNNKEYEIVDSNTIRKHDSVPYRKHGLIKDSGALINGKTTYARIPIKRKS